MTDAVLPRLADVALLVIDIQERLVPAMSNPELEKNAATLVEVARTFEWPIVYSEQYPKGLKPTTEPVLGPLTKAGASRVEKMEFSLARNEAFATNVLRKLPNNLVVIGIESHVCVLQTVVDLQNRGYQCFVPHDAVSSRDPKNCENGLALMAKAGAVIVNTESLLFHALGSAEHPEFKRLSKLIR
jgi:nicotinamidase-related amidase